MGCGRADNSACGANKMLGEAEPNANPGYSQLPDGRGGTNVEATVYTKEMGFDKARSLKAFQETLYPLLRAELLRVP